MSRSMIFDTQGTGFYKKAVRQMMDQPEFTFLSGLGGDGALGDEIMLLSGMDDLSENYPHGFDDGPARTYTFPSPSRGTEYEFPSGPAEMGMSGMRLGGPLGDQTDWPMQRSRYAPVPFRYSGLATPPDYHYTGLGDWPVQKSRYARREYRYTGLNGHSSGIGEMSADSKAGLAIGAVAIGVAYWLSR